MIQRFFKTSNFIFVQGAVQGGCAMKRAFLLILLLLLSSPLYGEETDEVKKEDTSEDILSEAEGLFEDAEEDEQAAGQEGIENLLSGYLETNFQLAQDPEEGEEWHLLNANKLKLKLDKRIRGIHFHGEINFLYYNGSTTYNIVDSLPQEYRAPLEPSRDEFDFSLEDTLKVAQAYATIPVGPLRFTIGRQPLALGTGYVWNPVDPLNKKNIREPSYEIQAHDAVKLSIPLPLNGEARSAFIMGDDLSKTAGFVSAKVNALFDWEVSFATIEQAYTDFFTPDTHWERDTTAGFAFSGQAGEVGIHGEAAYYFPSNSSNHFRWLIGGDYTFSFQNKIMVEFYRNDSGQKRWQHYTLEEWLAFLSGERTGMGKNYLYASMTQTLFSIASVSLSALMNATDSSFTAFPEGKINISELVEIRFILYLSSGKEGTEFGGFPSAAELRATGYF